MWLASYNLICTYAKFISESHKSAHDVLSTIIVLISCLSVPTVIFVIWRVEKCRSRKPGT